MCPTGEHMKTFKIIGLLILIIGNMVYGQNNPERINIGNLSLIIPDGYTFGASMGVDGIGRDAFKSIRSIGETSNTHVSLLFFEISGNFKNPDGGIDVSDTNRIKSFIDGDINDIRNIYGQLRRNTINSINVCEVFRIAEHDRVNVTFHRQIIFFDSTYCYELTIRYDDIKDEIVREMPEYFVFDKEWREYKYPEGQYRWTSIAPIYENYKKGGVLPMPVENLFNKSNEIFNTIEIKEDWGK
jgi:hypothetical protein